MANLEAKYNQKPHEPSPSDAGGSSDLKLEKGKERRIFIFSLSPPSYSSLLEPTLAGEGAPRRKLFSQRPTLQTILSARYSFLQTRPPVTTGQVITIIPSGPADSPGTVNNSTNLDLQPRQNLPVKRTLKDLSPHNMYILNLPRVKGCSNSYLHLKGLTR